ncbi:hypothetical protein AURDEDRAFT_70953, partial [Auricularia subglabra TFB-10046 SS5]
MACLAGGKTRPPPPDGYKFKESSVVSKRLPPSPCKVCGSPNHWDKECEHFTAYLEKRRRGALVAYDCAPEEETLYEAVYAAIHKNTSASSAYEPRLPALRALDEIFNGAPEVETVEDEETVRIRTALEWKGPGLLDLTTVEPPAVEELPPRAGMKRDDGTESDEDEGAPELLESSDTEDEDNAEDNQADGFPEGGPSVQAAVFAQALAAAANVTEIAGPPPQDLPLRNPALPTTECILRMPKKRIFRPGQSSKGITVLSCRARLGSLDEQLLVITLDSGASLMLVHKAFLLGLKHPPKIRKGMKVRIAQLTSNTPDIEGYVEMSVFIRAEDGAMLEFDIEAYVVPEMTVPILLGEDWHQNYELDVLRSVEHGTRVGVAYFVRAKSHRRMKAARHRRKVALGNGELRAFKDVVVRANSTTMVDFASNLPLGQEWFVERNLVCVGKDTFLTIPNCLISTETSDIQLSAGEKTVKRRSAIPISNPTGTPYLVRAGTVLGRAKDPKSVLDIPRDEQKRQQYQDRATVLASLME